MATAAKREKQDSDVVGTLISLTFAFTLAMAFRGFVLEGFVIPTGSMGPTLMGEHVRVQSPVTGFEYPADSQMARLMTTLRDPRDPRGAGAIPIVDPMISTRMPVEQRAPAEVVQDSRAGDRVLVLKPLFAFTQPKRWDVVVFKMPVDPAGDAQNYIKRMVGMPNEALLLLDGDVFTGPADARTADLRIERKPEMVQRAVWQPVHDSDYQPVVPADALDKALRPVAAVAGIDLASIACPWKPADGATGWTLSPNRAWSHAGSGTTALRWESQAIPLDDWSAYNSIRMAYDAMRRTPRGIGDLGWRQDTCYPVSDLRLCASVECADMAAFATTFELTARSTVMEFAIRGKGEVSVSRRGMEGGEPLGSAAGTFAPRSDGTLSFECWHVDQQLWVFVNGGLVLQLPYEYKSLDDRVTSSMFGRTVEQYARRHTETRMPTPPALAWRFESAAPFTLHRVRLDRDLYYRPQLHDANNQQRINGDYLSGPAFATDYEHPARTGAKEYVMLGDNSASSRDSRLWGRAHALTLRTYGDSQPGVVPEAMIVGKAWAVYFPAPLGMKHGGVDFGRFRFIR
jgi:signal peptidase I